MEVHHHPHVEKKGFKEYFLEFLMIFLAVTMGFFAESIREHFVEKKVAHQYLESLKLELINNKNVFEAADSIFSSQIPPTDSLIVFFDGKKENEDLNTMNRLTRTARIVFAPPIDKSAYNQLVNSGGLKYIKNFALRDSLSKYEGLIEGFQSYYATINSYIISAFPDVSEIDNLQELTSIEPVSQLMPYPELSAKERREIINFYSIFHVKCVGYIGFMQRLSNVNDRLLKMTEEELGDE
jgi:hypothetical protein